MALAIGGALLAAGGGFGAGAWLVGAERSSGGENSEALAPAGVSSEASSFAADGEDTPSVEVRRGGVVQGGVLDARGGPMEGAGVTPRGKDADASSRLPSHVDRQREAVRVGSRAAPAAADAERRLEARGELGVLHGPIPRIPPEGASRARGATIVGDVAEGADGAAAPAVAERERPEDLPLAGADEAIAGRVRDPVGFPLAGAQVALARGGHPVTTDDAGRFELPGLPSGPHRLRVTHADYPPLEVAAGTEEPAELVLRFGGGIAAEVRDGQTGAPIPGATVALRQGRTTLERASGPDGRLEIQPLTPGAWQLRVEAPGYVPSTRAIEVPPGDRDLQLTVRDLRLVVERGARIAGTVRDGNGERVAGAVVEVGERRGRTDEDGRFELDDVPTGDVTVRAERRGATGALEVPLRPGDELVTLEVSIAP